MEGILVPLAFFASITAWIIVPKWLRHKAEMAREALKAKDPAEEARVKKLQERVENLENLVCRLDSEINFQIEKSLSSGRISTSTSESGHSQMPTTFMNVAAVLEGRYQILKELGRGGMGIVFQAYDKQLSEQVAIKILSPMLSNNTEALERMKREVSAARRITHPNVIRIHDISEVGGLNFVSMEFFVGESLKDSIKQNRVHVPDAGFQHRFPDLRRTRSGAPARHRASRSEIAKHHHQFRRPSQDHRFRTGQHGASRRNDRHRFDHGHAGIHGA